LLPLSSSRQDLLELERTQAALGKELARQPTTEEWAAAVGMPAPAFMVRAFAAHIA